MKRNKKGFTIVELVIVIAIIGVLAAVLIPTFINLTSKAQEASDQSLVKTLNTVLATKEGETGYEKVGTPSAMFKLLEDDGYNGEVLIKKQKSGKKILYNLAKNRFLFEENKGDDKADDLWEFKNNVQFDIENGYSIYLFNEYSTVGEVTATAGLDVGNNDEISKVNYDRHNASIGRTSVIRTNGGDLSVNAPKDIVKHYEKANIVDITAVAGDSYHEYGSATVAKIANGRIVVTEKAELEEIRAVASTGLDSSSEEVQYFNDIKVAVVGEAKMPAITRDRVAIDDISSSGTYSQFVLEVQNVESADEKAEENQKEYVWINVNNGESLTVVSDTKVEASKAKDVETVLVPVSETKSPAADSASKAVKVTKVSTFSELKAALTAKAEHIVFGNDIDVEGNGSVDGLVNINYSATIDGDGHALTGYGKRASNYPTLTINSSNNHTPSTTNIDVALKNLSIVNNASTGRPIETRGKLNSLTIENCLARATGSGNNQCLTIGGNQSTAAKVSIKDSTLTNGASSGYCIITFNPIEMDIDNSTIEGWAALYFKGISSSYGSYGSVVNVKNSVLTSENIYGGNSNDFAAITFEDDNVEVNLDSCTLTAKESGAANQTLVGISYIYNPYWVYLNIQTADTIADSKRASTARASTEDGALSANCRVNIKGETTSSYGKLISGDINYNQLSISGGTYVGVSDDLNDTPFLAENCSAIAINSTTQKVVKD